MQYKTIVHELIADRPTLQAQLASSGCSLSMLNQLAKTLKHYHEEALQRLRHQRPQASEVQLSSEALELAVHQLQQDLPSESDDEPLSLDAAMAFIRNQTD